MKALIIFILAIGISHVSIEAQDYSAQPNDQNIQTQAAQQNHATRNTGPQWQQRGQRDRFPQTDVDSRPDGGDMHANRNVDTAPRGHQLSSFASNINYCEVNYGNRLDAWHREIVGDTLGNLFFWLTVTEAAVLLLLSSYLVYLAREKRQRHIISADIVCQLYNAWAYSDHIARSVIAKHNHWMRELNEEYESKLRDGEKKASSENDQSLPIMSAVASSQLSPDRVDTSDTGSSEISPPERVVEVNGKKASIPSIEASRYEIVNPTLENNRVNDALAKVNRTAAEDAAESEWAKEKKRLEAQLAATREQNSALKRMLNVAREDESINGVGPLSGVIG
jgi:hypothetical protein